MVFVRYKKTKQAKYAYEVEAYWDPKLKKPRQRTRYLGKVVDEKKGKIEKVLYAKHRERQILDLGDIHLLSHVYTASGLEKIVKKSFAEYSFFIKTFIFNRILFPLPLKSLYYWASTNVLKEEGNISQLTSQNVTEILGKIGEEERVDEFFREYIKRVSSKSTLLLDLTAMPTLISSILSEWGYADSDVEYQIGFLLLSDKDTRAPLFFKLVPGNAVSVSLLEDALKEIQRYGISRPFLVLDRGFFSADNLEKMSEKRVGFVIGLPSSNKFSMNWLRRQPPQYKPLQTPFCLTAIITLVVWKKWC